MTITLTSNNSDFISKKLREYFFETFKDAKFDYAEGLAQDNNIVATQCTISEVNVNKDSEPLSIELSGTDGDGNDVSINVPENSKVFFNNRKLNITYGTKSSEKISLIRDTKSKSHKWYANSSEPLNQEIVTGYIPRKLRRVQHETHF